MEKIIKMQNDTVAGAIEFLSIMSLWFLGDLFTVQLFKNIATIAGVLYALNQSKVFYEGFLKKPINKLINYVKTKINKSSKQN